MIPELILIALLVGWVCRGKFDRLANAKIRFGWLVFLALSLYVVAEVIACVPALWERLSWFAAVSHAVEKVILLVMVVSNIRVPGAKIILAGMALNFIALCANHWIMPASPHALNVVFGDGYVETVKNLPHVRSAVMDASCELGFLCDIIAARQPFVLRPAVYSIGDLVMSVGIFIAIIGIMRTPRPDESVQAEEAKLDTCCK